MQAQPHTQPLQSAQSATALAPDSERLAALFESSEPGRLDVETRERTLVALLDVYPHAPVAALSAVGLYAPMPDSIPLGERPVLEGRSGLDTLGDEDRATVLASWDRVLSIGAGRYSVHPPNYGEVTVYALDLRERHGVILILLAPSNSLATRGEASESEPVAQRPRFATVHKSELSFFTDVDEPLLQILGWDAEEMLGRRSLEFVHPDDHGLAIDNWMQMLARPGPARRVRQRLRAKDGSWVWFEITNHNLLGDPEHGDVICEMVDITEEMAAHEDLRAREQLLDRLAETVPVGLMQLDGEREIVYTNDRLHEILGSPTAESVDAHLARVDRDGREAFVAALTELLRDGQDRELEVTVDGHDDGRRRHCQVSLRALTHDDGGISGAIACLADVTDSIEMREELRRRATYDQLTNCLNRAAITRALEQDVAAGGDDGQRAVLYVDLDGFKAINDEHGHAAGDELLRAVARHIADSVRAGDLVGRLGGDEFLVLCPAIDEPTACRLAERIRVSAANGPAGRTEVRASVGVTWSRGQRLDAQTLLALADREMYAAKRQRPAAPAALAAHA